MIIVMVWFVYLWYDIEYVIFYKDQYVLIQTYCKNCIGIIFICLYKINLNTEINLKMSKSVH